MAQYRACIMELTTMTVYAVITEDGIDQLVETMALAKSEAFDLQEMGCTVKIKQFASETDAYAYEEKHYK